MEGVFDILRRMLITALVPNHLTPWSDTSTTQGAESAMPPFLGRIKALQNHFTQFLNETVIADLRRTYPEISEDATFVFDEPKIIDDRYYIDKVTSLIDSELISREVGKNLLMKLGIIPEDIVEDEEELSIQKKELGKRISQHDEKVIADNMEIVNERDTIKVQQLLLAKDEDSITQREKGVEKEWLKIADQRSTLERAFNRIEK